MIYAQHEETVAGMRLVEPASPVDLLDLWERMRPEEREEGAALGTTFEGWLDAIRAARRLVSVFHRGELLGIGEMYDREGVRLISLERTDRCLAPGHRFAWLRGFPVLVRWFMKTDDAQGGCGRFVTVSPTDYPRALDLYGKCGFVQTRTTSIGGREYWILENGEVSDGV